MFIARRASAPVVVSLVAALAFPSVAHAGDWAESFKGPAVAEYVDATAAEVLVLSAGPSTKRANAAADDLRAGLGISAKSAQKSKTLGSLVKLDDDQILEKAKPFGAERIAIVRVFDDTDDAEAIVTIYDGQGRSIGGFSVGPGQTVATPVSAAAGHDQDLADAIATLGSDADQAEDEFERKQVVFDESLLVSSNGSVATVSRRFHPMTGEGRQLAGADFYKYVGRDDLAKKYRARKATRVGLGAGAVVTSVTGLGIMLGVGVGKSVAISNRECPGEYGSPESAMCEANNDADRSKSLKVGMGVGAGFIVGGIALAIVAVRINPHPVAGTEAFGLARAFNDSLRAELGLAKRRKDSSNVAAGPTAGPDSMGVQFAGRF